MNTVSRNKKEQAKQVVYVLASVFILVLCVTILGILIQLFPVASSIVFIFSLIVTFCRFFYIGFIAKEE